MAEAFNPLDTLRQAFNPKDDVKFELKVNEHPKGHTNKSIVNAINMKLSDDGVVLENDNKIEEVDAITTALNNHYGNNRKIVHVLPCNRELVLFVARDMNAPLYTTGTIDIWRYSEESNTIDIFYSKGIPWYGGKFSSAFTYTSNNSLIIAFCEHDSIGLNKTYDCPLRTINLGNFDKSSNIFNDRDIEVYKTPLCPEVCLPQIENNNIINGSSYIGIYYFYIRYKINQYDYTQWYNFGYPIYHEHISTELIHKKVKTNVENKDSYGNELIGAFATTVPPLINVNTNKNKDLLEYSIIIDILHKNILYDYCQIGYICVAANYTKYYMSSDIKLQSSIKFNTNINSLKEEQFNISKYENYFDVKNIVNINNKLYISNYKIFDDNKKLNINNINLKLDYKSFNLTSVDDFFKSNFIFNNITFNKNVSTIFNLVRIEEIRYPAEIYYGSRPFYYYSNKKEFVKYINLVYWLDIVGKKDYITSNTYKVETRYTKRNDDGTFTPVTEHPYGDKYFPLDKFYIGTDKKIFREYKDDKQKPTEEISAKQRQCVQFFCDTIFSGIKYGDINTLYEEPLYVSGITYDVVPNDTFSKECMLRIYLIEAGTGKEILINDTFAYRDNALTYNMNPIIRNNIYKSNTITDFINNNNITSLVQGEIYDFYIHFIDKYGNTTNGYKLSNNEDLYTCSISQTETIKGGYFIYYSNNESKYKLAFIKDNYIITGTNDANKKLNISASTVYVHTSYPILSGSWIKATSPQYEEIKTGLSHLIDIPFSVAKTLQFSDILDECPFLVHMRFLPFINSNGDKLYRVPRLNCRQNTDHVYIITPRVTYTNGTIENFCNNNGFVSYFISYKQLEHTYCIDGIGNENQMTNILLNTKYKSGYLVHKYNITNSLNFASITKIYKEQLYNSTYSNIYTNFNNIIAYAESTTNNRTNRHTSLYLSDDVTELDFTSTDYPAYIEILNISKDIYTTDNFYLYRLGNILNSNENTITVGLNGRYKNHIALWYGSRTNGVKSIQSKVGKTSYGNVFGFEIYGFYDDDNNGIYIDNIIYSVNVYNNVNDNGPSGSPIDTEVFFDTVDIPTLFKYKITNIYNSNPEIYTHVISNYFLNEFNNTIYRSNVISDEGRVNNWRYFESNAYKNINENKGFITNLVHIGKYLYVHTQHSLFAFNNDAALEMNNKNLQVATPDLFDTEYSEAYLTNLGYGGLQDKESSIVGTFGYMYYNRDNNEIIKIYSTEKKIITDDIKTLFNNLNVKRVMFMNDSVNNRVFIQITHQYTTPLPTGKYKTHTQYIVLSYNYKVNKFISLHSTLMEPITQSYATSGNGRELNVDSFRYAVNTKDTLYMFNKDDFKHSLYKFGKGYNNLNKVSIIFNHYYDTIKYVEYLVYKLRKTNNVVNDAFNFNRLPVEKEDIPYSGVGIRIYNDLVDTGWIDVRQANTSYKDVDNTVDNYSKPYYQLGNWMFNFIRTESITDSEGNVIPTRLFGNYFVVEFSFGINTEKIEFEFTDLVTSKDKKI